MTLGASGSIGSCFTPPATVNVESAPENGRDQHWRTDGVRIVLEGIMRCKLGTNELLSRVRTVYCIGTASLGVDCGCSKDVGRNVNGSKSLFSQRQKITVDGIVPTSEMSTVQG